MIKNSLGQKGSIHVILAVVVVVALVGGLGLVFWQNFHKTDTTKQDAVTSTAKTEQTKPASVPAEKPKAVDPTSDWETTKSPLTGYTIKYPSDWILAQGSETGEQILTNIGGGKFFNVTLKSAKSDGTPMKLPTIRYMCVVVDDYTGDWAYGSSLSKISPTVLTHFQPNNATTLNLSVTPSLGSPDVSMLSQMHVMTASGEMLIPLSGGGKLQVSASFDCTQGDSDALKGSKEIFLDQPETKTAETIIKSLRFQ